MPCLITEAVTFNNPIKLQIEQGFKAGVTD